MIISIVTIISTGLTPLLIVVTFWPVYSQFQKIIDAKTWSNDRKVREIFQTTEFFYLVISRLKSA